MAVYKVPQDVEADDKLIGPFNFRQFVYLLIAAGLIAAAVGLAQLFPVLAIIPLPPVALLLALALPLKKDQPMETYLAAIVSFHLKPRKRVWMPGQKETTIVITAPKIVEDVRTKSLSEDEANKRLSFLADVVDTQGLSIKNPSIMRDDLVAEANATIDMFDERQTFNLQRSVTEDEMARHRDALLEMQRAIEAAEKTRNTRDFSATTSHEESVYEQTATSENYDTTGGAVGYSMTGGAENYNVGTMGGTQNYDAAAGVENYNTEVRADDLEKSPESSIIELANNSDFSIATIAKEANRIKRKEKDEVFISLH